MRGSRSHRPPPRTTQPPSVRPRLTLERQSGRCVIPILERKPSLPRRGRRAQVTRSTARQGLGPTPGSEGGSARRYQRRENGGRVGDLLVRGPQDRLQVGQLDAGLPSSILATARTPAQHLQPRLGGLHSSLEANHLLQEGLLGPCRKPPAQRSQSSDAFTPTPSSPNPQGLHPCLLSPRAQPNPLTSSEHPTVSPGAKSAHFTDAKAEAQRR